jgi:hypothetical protein
MKTINLEMAMRRVLLATAFGWLLAACGCAGMQQSNGTGGLPGSPTITPATAAVTICDATQSNCQSSTAAFSLSSPKVPDLNIVVDWADVPSGTHSQEIRLLMPNGDVFQKLQNTFVVTTNGTGRASVSRNIPISGSFIADRQITGGWKVEVSLDGNTTTTGNLQLNP